MTSIKVWTTTLSYKDYDFRDYLVDNLLKDIPWINPIKFYHYLTETYYQNWWWSCTAMWTTHAMKIQNEKEHWKVFLNWKDLRVRMWHHLDDKSDSWDSVENAVKTAVKGWILWELDWKPHIFKAICWAYWKRDNWKRIITKQPLITVIYWNDKTWDEMIYWEVKTILGRSNKLLWHCILLRWFDEKRVYFYNSFWDSVTKNGVSEFKITRDKFDLAIGRWMVNWRYFVILDKSDVDEYVKHREISKQIIDACKKLYEIWDKDIRSFFENVWITKKLTEKYLKWV